MQVYWWDLYAIYMKFIKYLSAIFFLLCCALWFNITKFIANAHFYDVIIFSFSFPSPHTTVAPAPNTLYFFFADFQG